MIDIKELLKKVDEGDESPLNAYAILKGVLKETQDAIATIEPHALQEAEGYTEKTFVEFGYSFERREGAKRYDFSGIKEWSDLKDSMKEKEKSYKIAASAYDNGKQIFDEETGEQIPIPKVMYNKASIIVKKA